MVQCSWLVCSVLPEYYGVLKGFEEQIMTQKFTGVMNLIAHSVYIHWKEYRKYGWIQTSPTRTSDDIVAPSWSQIYTWQSNDLSSVYCMDEFKISAIEALAAAKSVEGRQNDDDITRRCSPGVGRRTGVIERPTMSVFRESKDFWRWYTSSFIAATQRCATDGTHSTR